MSIGKSVKDEDHKLSKKYHSTCTERARNGFQRQSMFSLFSSYFSVQTIQQQSTQSTVLNAQDCIYMTIIIVPGSRLSLQKVISIQQPKLEHKQYLIKFWLTRYTLRSLQWTPLFQKDSTRIRVSLSDYSCFGKNYLDILHIVSTLTMA